MKILSSVEVLLSHSKAYHEFVCLSERFTKDKLKGDSVHLYIQYDGVFFEAEGVLCYSRLSGETLAYVQPLGGWRFISSSEPNVTSIGSKSLN